MNSETKICQNCQQNFTIEPEDFAFYDKISAKGGSASGGKVPPPTFCPECRLIRRMAFRNERALYKRKCDAPGHSEEIISIYSSDKQLKVYDQKFWWSDGWNPLEFGRDYNFDKPFFEQFKNFRDNFPLMSVSNANAINSDYCNVADQSKDCYLISAAFKNENVLYSNRTFNNKDSLDLYVVFKSELCYSNVNCKESYRLFFSKDSHNSTDSYFLYDCKNCSNCFGCVDLRNKQYYIFNKPYNKEGYLAKINEFDTGSFKNVLKFTSIFNEQYNKSIHRYATIMKSVNVLGDYIDNTKNCQYCFDITEGAEDCKFIVWGGVLLKDTYDGGPGIGGGGELIYEAFDTGIQGSRNFFTSVVYGSRDIQYSFNCHNSSNLFACVGLRNKQYCILNKQYSKEEYEKLVPQIIKHINNMPYIVKIQNDNSKSKNEENYREIIYRYGEFFPPQLSPFAYNETIAQEYFPLTKQQAIEQGYSWKDSEKRQLTITLTTDQLPDHIKDVKDDIINQIIECQHNNQNNNSNQNCNEQCTQAFKIIKPELDFYRKMNLPLPRLCPNCRHYQRLKQRNPLKLWHRKCQCAGTQSDNKIYQNTINHFHNQEHCLNEFETTYSPDRPEIVYCEKCYQQEVV
ncbi:MAG: hypothetical protein AAB405_03010 [Patescibacteria group bacterium]